MRHQTILLLCTLLASASVFAQSHPSTDKTHDGLAAAPAETASTAVPKAASPDMHEGLPFQQEAKPSPFKFKDQKQHSGVTDRPPPSANDKSAVMGTQRPWQSGRPPVDCTMTPHGDGC